MYVYIYNNLEEIKKQFFFENTVPAVVEDVSDVEFVDVVVSKSY